MVHYTEKPLHDLMEQSRHSLTVLRLSLPELQILIDPHLPDEFIEVRDEHHSPLILIECFRDNGKVTEIYMIRGLIEEEESWFLENEFTEHEESFLSL
jgi:hypothetical protein